MIKKKRGERKGLLKTAREYKSFSLFEMTDSTNPDPKKKLKKDIKKK